MIFGHVARSIADFLAGAALYEPRSADFVAGAALGEPRSADFAAGAALCEPRSADFVAGAAGCRVPLVVPGAGAVSWLCTWWRQVAGADAGAGCRVLVLVLGAGRRCWCWWCRVPVLVLVLLAGCARGGNRLLVPVLAVECCELAAHVVETWCRCWVGAGRRCWCGCCELAVCAQHHTVSLLERSLSISAVGYLPSSGSVLADSCVKGCTVCAHTFVRTMFYAQRQALNQPLFQRVSACYTHSSRAGNCLALGE